MLIYSTNTRKCPILRWIFFHPTFIPPYRASYFSTTNKAVLEAKNSTNDIKNIDTLSNDEVAASDVSLAALVSPSFLVF